MTFVTMRQATSEDRRRTFVWRSADTVRQASIDTGAFNYDHHCRWFDQVLRDENRHLLIGVEGTEPVGVVRFDRRASGRFAVSIYLDPAQTGRGLGGMVLLAGERWLVGHRGPATVVAEIRPENAISRAIFRRCGYLAGIEENSYVKKVT